MVANRVEDMLDEFDQDADRWSTEVNYEVAAAQHDKPAPLSVVVDITVPGEPFLNLLRVLRCELRGS